MSGSNKGFILLHRKILDSAIWQCGERYSKRDAWIELLLTANHKDKELLFDGQMIVIHRGQLLTSQRKLAEKWGWHHCTTKRYLDMLKNAGMIHVDSSKRATLISIVNYQQYQGFEHGSASTKCNTDYPLSSALSIHSLSTDYQQTTMYNNNNNDNNEKQIEPEPPDEEGEWQ